MWQHFRNQRGPARSLESNVGTFLTSQENRKIASTLSPVVSKKMLRVDVASDRMSKAEVFTVTRVYRRGYCLKHWSVTRATFSLSSAEADATAITKDFREGTYVENPLEGLKSEKKNSKIGRIDQVRVHFHLGPRPRPKHLEVQTVWVQQVPKQNILVVHKRNTRRVWSTRTDAAGAQSKVRQDE